MLATGALLAVSYALWLLAAWPSGDFPLNDDWAYAWSVRRFLETGTIRLSEWASAAAIFQIFWGALFATLAGGFSFDALRASTLVFSIVSPLALCVMLRRLELSRSTALLGALALLANPIFVHLSYTFMTDVFYLGLMLVSLALYVDGIERDAPLSLWAGSLAAAAAFLSRQLGLALPAAVVLVLFARHRREALRRASCAAVVPAVVFLLYTFWLREIHGVPWALRLNTIQKGTANLLRTSAPLELWVRVLYALLYLGVFASPALVAVAASRRHGAARIRQLAGPFAFWLFLLALATVYGYAEYGRGQPFLGGVITRDGLGGATLGGVKPRSTPEWVFDAMTLLAPLPGAALAALWTDALRHPRRELAGRGAVVLLATLLMASVTGPMVHLWDEYLLVFVPASLYLVLREVRLTPRGWLAGAVVCASMLVYALVEQAEYLAWNDARWKLGRQLIDHGASPVEIQGGFEWVGWYDFERALPLSIAAGHGSELYGWVAVFPDRYFLAFQPLGAEKGRSRVVGQVDYRTRFGPGGTVYALEAATR